MRTHGAGTLRASDAGTTVTLAGWVARRRDHGGVAFLDLRDSTGIAQVVVRDELLASSDAHDLRSEYCVTVTGEVAARPAGNANPDLPSGDIEVVATAQQFGASALSVAIVVKLLRVLLLAPLVAGAGVLVSDRLSPVMSVLVTLVLVAIGTGFGSALTAMGWRSRIVKTAAASLPSGARVRPVR